MGGNVDRWMQTGIRGVVVLGSNGEAPFLSEFESDAAVAAGKEHVSDRPVVTDEAQAAAAGIQRVVSRRRDERGGFHNQLRDDGTVYDASTKHVVGTCRFSVNFALASRFDRSGVLIVCPESFGCDGPLG